MKVLITGASGLLGRAVMKEFRANEHDALGIVFSRMPSDGGQYVKCDLRDYDAFLKIVTDASPHVIIHCAAERRPDVCKSDPELAQTLNITVTENVAKAAAAADAWIIYLSTDYVFNGRADEDGNNGPPYKANAKPSPLNLYGRTKLQGEVAVRRVKRDAGILRVGVLYGDCESLSESSVTALLEKVKSSVDSKEPVVVDGWGLRYPTYTGDVAYILRGLAERKRKYCGFYGTWHWCGSEQVTKFDLCNKLAKIAGITKTNIEAQTEPPKDAAPRPHDTRLETAAIDLMGLSKRTSLNEGLAQTIAPFLPDSTQDAQEREQNEK